MNLSALASRNYKQRVKRECFQLFGDKCKACEYSDIRALQLDHTHGNPHRRAGQYGRGSTGLYIAILKGRLPVSAFQLLCANCNWIKRMESRRENGRKRETTCPAQ